LNPIIDDAINRNFQVIDKYIYYNQPTYVINSKSKNGDKTQLKKSFELLVSDIRPFGYLPKLQKKVDQYIITVFKISKQAEQNSRKNIFLFVATVATVFLDGYLRSNNPILTKILMSGTPIYVNATYFTLAILGVFGLHELGHKLISMLRGIEASMPFFLPAPPGMGGTFGAVITQKEPPINRDSLFDLGFSGPFVGFLITIVVAVLGLRLSFTVPLEEVNAWMVMFPQVGFQTIPFPLLIEGLTTIVRPSSKDMVLLLHPVGFAAWVGCLVTFINLIPAWQLDGGHISRALFGEKYHKYISIMGILIMIFLGYIVMALMVGFFMMRSGSESGGPLDDISPLSFSRKILTLGYIAMLVLTAVTVTTF
jgi:membrane-associated protease RseP (regulator of RpoE activity)